VKDESIKVLILDWLFEIRAESLERLWITTDIDDDVLNLNGLLGEFRGPTVKSIVSVLRPGSDPYDLSMFNDKKCHQLEHLLGDIPFDKVENGLQQPTELKYANGSCYYDSEV